MTGDAAVWHFLLRDGIYYSLHQYNQFANDGCKTEARMKVRNATAAAGSQTGKKTNLTLFHEQGGKKRTP